MVKRKVVIQNDLGLHARPAAKLAEAARKFQAKVYLRKGSQQVEAESILDVLSLACTKGSIIEIWAEGEEAERAVSEIVELLTEKIS
ncbi:MAG: HPr family phosphocarrier protein [Thermodesulfobacteria bacterium]|nr:HPr family phosphocarrier protein [Thermodesulfobacteriota bacterium]